MASRVFLMISRSLHSDDARQSNFAAKALADTEQQRRNAENLSADSNDGSTECSDVGVKHSVTDISPNQTATGKLQGKLTLKKFSRDEEDRILCCPQGQKPLENGIIDARLQLLFEVVVCKS